MSRTTLFSGRIDPAEVDHQDTVETANARVSLKLAAEGYNAARFGADAGERLIGAALAILRARAIHYYCQLQRTNLRGRLPDDLSHLHEDPLVDQLFAQLQIFAVAYSNTRSGADAHSVFTRHAIAELCLASIAYVEGLLRAHRDPESRPRGKGDGRLRSGLNDEGET